MLPGILTRARQLGHEEGPRAATWLTPTGLESPGTPANELPSAKTHRQRGLQFFTSPGKVQRIKEAGAKGYQSWGKNKHTPALGQLLLESPAKARCGFVSHAKHHTSAGGFKQPGNRCPAPPPPQTCTHGHTGSPVAVPRPWAPACSSLVTGRPQSFTRSVTE